MQINFKSVICAFFVPALLLSAVTSMPSNAVPLSNRDKYFAEARDLVNRRQFKGAKNILVRLCQLPDATGEMFLLLGQSYIQLEDSDDVSVMQKAEASVRQGVKMRPDLGQGYLELAELSNMNEQYKESVNFANQALTAKVPAPDALKQRLIAYSHLGREQDALNDMIKFMSYKDHDTWMNYLQKGQLEESLHKYHDAEISLRTAQKQATAYNAKINHLLINVMISAGKYKEAIADQSAFIKTDPLTAENYETRGQLYLKINDRQSALKDFTKAIEMLPAARYFQERAAVYKALGQNQAAAGDLQKATECRDSESQFP